jgi:hypothetical protein
MRGIGGPSGIPVPDIERQEPPQVFQPKETALRLNISPSMLRKLTLAGEIGHVRLGIGSKRQRFGYTESQIAEFIASRSVPAARQAPPPQRQRAVRTARRAAAPPEGTGLAAQQLLEAAIVAGQATEWRRMT